MLVSPSTDAVSIWLDGSCERRFRTSASLCWLSSLVGPKDKDSIVRLAGFDSLMAHLTQYGLIVILATFRSHRRAGFLGQCDRFVGLCLRPGCMDDTYLTKPFSTYGRSSDRNTVRALDHVRDADSLRTSPVPLHPVWPKAGCTLLGTYPTSLSALAILYSKGCRARKDRTSYPDPRQSPRASQCKGFADYPRKALSLRAGM